MNNGLMTPGQGRLRLWSFAPFDAILLISMDSTSHSQRTAFYGPTLVRMSIEIWTSSERGCSSLSTLSLLVIFPFLAFLCLRTVRDIEMSVVRNRILSCNIIIHQTRLYFSGMYML